MANLSKGFKVPCLNTYGGSGDRLNHLKAFRSMMMLHTAPDAILCIAFLATLTKVVRILYSNI